MEDGVVGPHIQPVAVIVRGLKLGPAITPVHLMEVPIVRVLGCTPTHALVEVVQTKVQCGQLGQHGHLVAATVRDLDTEHVMEEYVRVSIMNQIPALEEVAQLQLLLMANGEVGLHIQHVEVTV